LIGCCGAAFGFKWRRIWVREEVSCVHDYVSNIFQTKEVENLMKIVEKKPRYQELLVLEKASTETSGAVSHNGALNALSGRKLTR